jgi:hypothetical protein
MTVRDSPKFAEKFADEKRRRQIAAIGLLRDLAANFSAKKNYMGDF